MEKLKENLPLRYIVRIIAFFAITMLLINIIPPTDAISVNPFSQPEGIRTVSASGGGAALPDNVMLSFNTAASSYGVMTFSIGVVMTADEKLVVADYDELSVYTSQTGRISEKTLEELSLLNFAHNFTADNGLSYQYRNQVLKCIEINDLFGSYPYTDYIINIVQTGQEGIRAAVLLCEAIRVNDLSLRVVIKGSDEVVRSAREETNVHILTEPCGLELQSFEGFHNLGLGNLYLKMKFQYLEIDVDNLGKYSKRMLAALQKRNVCIYVSGVETIEDYQRAKAVNLDGIITDYPEAVLEFIAVDASDLPQ